MGKLIKAGSKKEKPYILKKPAKNEKKPRSAGRAHRIRDGRKSLTDEKGNYRLDYRRTKL